MISTFVKLSSQLKPPITVDIISFYGSLASLELLKFGQVLIASATYGIDIPVVSLGICKVSAASMHEFALFEYILLENIFIILF